MLNLDFILNLILNNLYTKWNFPKNCLTLVPEIGTLNQQPLTIHKTTISETKHVET